MGLDVGALKNNPIFLGVSAAFQQSPYSSREHFQNLRSGEAGPHTEFVRGELSRGTFTSDMEELLKPSRDVRAEDFMHVSIHQHPWTCLSPCTQR